MKSSLQLISVFAGIVFLFSSCDSGYKNRYQDIKVGYTEYKDCLKECDKKEAEYNAAYIACFNEHYTAFVNSVECNRYSDCSVYKQCVAREKLQFKLNVDACLKTYQNHVLEIAACRATCLAKFNGQFRSE